MGYLIAKSTDKAEKWFRIHFAFMVVSYFPVCMFAIEIGVVTVGILLAGTCIGYMTGWQARSRYQYRKTPPPPRYYDT